VRLFAAIQRDFGVRLSLSTLFSAPTLGALAHSVAQSGALSGPSGAGALVAAPGPVGAPSTTTRPGAARTAIAPATPIGSLLVPIRAQGTRTPLFCVHPAGGELFAYAPLTRHLPGDQPVIGIREEGLDGLVPRLPNVEAMAARYVLEVRHAQPQGPYRLAGYSLGGLVAYEMARRLQELGETVEVLALIDAIPTHPIRGAHRVSAADDPTDTPRSARGKVSRMMHRARRDGLGETAARLARNRVRLHIVEPLEAVTDSARVFVATQRRVPVDPIVAGRHSERHGVVALSRYRASAYDGDAMLFRATGADLDFPIRDERQHWHGAIQGEFEVVDIQGDHAGPRAIVEEPYVAALGAALADLLSRHDRRTTT
jgi:thioesterase domain-containing protein